MAADDRPLRHGWGWRPSRSGLHGHRRPFPAASGLQVPPIRQAMLATNVGSMHRHQQATEDASNQPQRGGGDILPSGRQHDLETHYEGDPYGKMCARNESEAPKAREERRRNFNPKAPEKTPEGWCIRASPHAGPGEQFEGDRAFFTESHCDTARRTAPGLRDVASIAVKRAPGPGAVQFPTATRKRRPHPPGAARPLPPPTPRTKRRGGGLSSPFERVEIPRVFAIFLTCENETAAPRRD